MPLDSLREHPWPTTLPEAQALQNELRTQVRLVDQPNPPQTVAGVDVGFLEDGAVARAAVVVLRFPELTPCDHAVAFAPVQFPYVPGYLSFRETPVILQAIAQLTTMPDLIICDGQGIAHPRRFGIAAHLGVLLGCPTIGCAKTRFIGSHPPLPGEHGARVPLSDAGEQIGWVVRTRTNANPVYVSPGHLVSMDSAADIVLACTTRYRLPETTRYAHRLASYGTLP
jgi:deoxyribonuclease V